MEGCENCFTCQVGDANSIPKQQIKGQCQIHKGQEQVKPSESKFSELVVWASGRCNLRCEYCFVWDKNAPPMGELEDKVIEALPAFIRKYGNPQGVSIWFFGGEPLMGYEQIKKTYDKLIIQEKMPVTFGLTTNCTLLTKEKAEWLGNHNFGSNCSIDGFSKTGGHRVYAGTKDSSWKQAFEGIKNARTYMQNDPIYRWTVTPDQAPDIWEGFMFCLDNGFNNIGLEPAYEPFWDAESLRISAEQIKKIGEYMVAHPKKDIKFNPLNHVNDILDNKSFSNGSWANRCGLGQGSCSIDVDGSIYACQRFAGQHNKELFYIGNVFDGIDQKKRDAVSQLFAQKRPYNVNNPDRCKTCVNKNACNGCCVAMNWEIYNNLGKVSDNFCNITDAWTEALIISAIKLRKNKPQGGCGGNC